MTIAGALTLSAQTSSTPQTQTTPKTADQRSSSEQTVTVAGCLQQNSGTGMSGSGSAGSAGSATSGGTGSSAGSTSSAGASGSSKFVLANAKMAQGSSTSGLGTATRLSVTGMSDAELSKHLNHQVELTGRLSAATSGTTGTTGAAGTTGSATGSGSTGTTARSGGTTGAGMNDMPQLHATNLKMISATCPAQQ